MSELKTFIDTKFKVLPNTKEVKNIKEEMLVNLQDKAIKLINEGYLEKEAYKKVMDDFGDIDELMEAYDIKDYPNKKIILLGNIILTFALVYFVYFKYIPRFFIFNRDKLHFQYLYINILHVPFIENEFYIRYPVILFLLIGLNIMGWILYIFRFNKDIVSVLLSTLGFLIIILGSYYIGVIYLLAGLISYTKQHNKVIIISIIVSILFVLLTMSGYIGFIINLFSPEPNDQRLNVLFRYASPIFYLVLNIVMLFTFIFKQKENKGLISFGFYSILTMSVLHIIFKNYVFLYLGFPLAIYFVLMKLEKQTVENM